MEGLCLLLGLLAGPVLGSKRFDLDRVGFILDSQAHKHHRGLAIDTKYDLIGDLLQQGCSRPKIIMSHDLDRPGYWTFYPILDQLLQEYEGSLDWFVFLPEATRVNLDVLRNVLRGQCHPRSRKMFIFNPVAMPRRSNMYYPHPGAGFVLSVKLVQALSEIPASKWRRCEILYVYDSFGMNAVLLVMPAMQPCSIDEFSFFVFSFKVGTAGDEVMTQFSTDPLVDLARTVQEKCGGEEKEEDKEGSLKIIHENRLCFKDSETCATAPR